MWWTSSHDWRRQRFSEVSAEVHQSAKNIQIQNELMFLLKLFSVIVIKLFRFHLSKLYFHHF